MTEQAAKTGAEPTVLSALEQNFPPDRRILVDDLAIRVLPAGARVLVRLSKPVIGSLVRLAGRSSDRGMWGGLLCRKRWFDEQLLGSVGSVEQVVNLGAGLDTRLYRLPALRSVLVWELDQAGNIERKRRSFTRALGRIPANIDLVAIDFDRESVADVLARRGYDAGRRTFFIWEAVTQYLTEPALESTFRFLSGAAPGSIVAFTYVHQDFLDGKDLFGWKAGYDRFVRPHVFRHGMRPEGLPGELARWGYRLVEDLDYSRLADRYIPAGRDLTASALEHVVLAEKV